MPMRTLIHRELDPSVLAVAEAHGRNPESTLDNFQVLQAEHSGLTKAMVDDILPPPECPGRTHL